MKILVKVSMSILVTITVVSSTGRAASASPPSNDSESSAVRIDALPFTHSVDTTDANADGPRFCTTRASVFNAFTPSADMRVQVDTLGSEYDTTIAIYTRDDAGQVEQIGNDDRIGLASGLRLRAVAGTDYLFMVGSCCGNPPRGEPGESGGPLVLSVTEVSSVPPEATIVWTTGRWIRARASLRSPAPSVAPGVPACTRRARCGRCARRCSSRAATGTRLCLHAGRPVAVVDEANGGPGPVM